MAEAATLDALWKAVKCPVCLNDLKISITLGCELQRGIGHKQEPAGKGDRYCQDAASRSKAESQGESPLCEKHNLVLTPVCEEDLELLCLHCSWPAEQKGHCVRPITEAASEHRAQIYRCIKPLKRQVVGLAQWPETLLSKADEGKNYLKHKCDEDVRAFVDHISTLTCLLMELAEKSVMSEVELLMSIKGILYRCANLKPWLCTHSKQGQQELSCALPCLALRSKWALNPHGLWGVVQNLFAEGKISPQNPCRAIQMHHGEYMAWGARPVTLRLREKPSQVGIFLDYSLGEISFYNLSARSYIYYFMDKLFEVLRPYFYLACDSKPFRIWPVTDVAD
ncbi:putative tripartite motif-containing protein 75 [Ochotona curzoniae]|uniref:putative tripartite motif-containing protein 75 n=1 Tax=Ochotona curzoniae TaxID=130825 RepID=UPI001B352A59|nr:putative tripartite motif-containing protein 75 [Ochotona curzoniae]